jgi:Glucose-6-phosphate 1-dehydrogenase
MKARASMTVAAPEAAPRPAKQLRRPEPCTLIIFGAGDLLHRKLMPSLFHLMGDGLLPDEYAVITVARAQGDDESFRTEVGNSLRTFAPDGGVDQAAWRRFAPHLHYLPASWTIRRRTPRCANGWPRATRRCRAAAATCSTSRSHRASTRKRSTGWPNRGSRPGCRTPSSARGPG